jgi:hypothetical protein
MCANLRATGFDEKETDMKRFMRRALMGTGAAIALGLMTGAAGTASAEPTYVGVKKCRTCHKKELIGNQHAAWEKSKHAQAFEALKSDKAVELAKQKGIAGPPHQAKECLKCHVTAYGQPATAFDKGKLLSEADGVQCESCHGPGSDYKKKSTMADHAKAVAAGLWEPGKDQKICTGCHNDESPNFAGFDYEAAKKKIAHPIPEDVKGKYIEIEKQRRAEKRASGGADDEDDE